MGLLRKISFSIAALVLLLVGGVCGWLFVYTGDLPDFDHLSQFAPSAQSVVSDSCLAGPSTVVPFDGTGKPLRDALAAAEPTRFLPAASWPDRIADTLLCNRREGEGKRHLPEFRLSWHIRRRFSERQLITVYANRAYFGPGGTGIEAASRQFFHKAPDTLSAEEAAMIAGLFRAPAIYSPYKHPERALERRNKVLESMAAQGNLSAVEAVRAEATPLGVVGHLSEKGKSLLP
jgi:penicillin-binding protein 1A